MLLLIGWVTGWMLQAPAQAPGRAPEYQVKAAFLYNFARFIEWPAGTFVGPDDPFVVGVIGRDPFGPHLDSIAKEKIGENRPIVIRRYNRGEAHDGCHILFISRSEKERVADLIKSSRGKPLLTVAEDVDFCISGGGIGLLQENNRLRFEINLSATDRAQLKVSAQLLKLGRVIRDEL
ncbi:MAG TPA: YfiR family protein [Roseimicrobium sp.]|nr:YfiR family protein [Roseimicrobium sp.]